MVDYSRNEKVEAYIERMTRWTSEMIELRKILFATELHEELKWGKPCYMLGDANVVMIIAFKEYCALSFLKGALLNDSEGMLVSAGENSQAARQIRFTDLKQIIEKQKILAGYIQQAIDVEKAGLKVEFKKSAELELPEELHRKFAEDAALQRAFESLTPGRQRAYVLYFSAPKQSQTRENRIEKYAQQILDGKGMND
ncbi:MAG: YdeI family protein [Anaerofustis sp.]